MRRACFLALLTGCVCAAQSVITGDYVEDRANKVYGCYCEWSGEGEHGGREAVLAWHIRSGEFRGVPLAGVKFAVVILGERTLSRGAAPRRTILYIDSEAAPAQRKAAEALARERYGALMGEVAGVHAAPIEFRREPGGAFLRVGNEVNLEMRKARPVEDSLQGAILWYDPFIALEEATLGTTLNVKYVGADFGHRWDRSDAGITGYYGAFKLALR
jgi:hypothetical protein